MIVEAVVMVNDGAVGGSNLLVVARTGLREGKGYGT